MPVPKDVFKALMDRNISMALRRAGLSTPRIIIAVVILIVVLALAYTFLFFGFVVRGPHIL